MNEWTTAEIVGFALSGLFGTVTVIQFVKDLLKKKTYDAHRQHLRAVKAQLQIQRSRCSEAIELGETVKTDASRDFVRQIGYSLLSIEQHIDAIIGDS